MSKHIPLLKGIYNSFMQEVCKCLNTRTNMFEDKHQNNSDKELKPAFEIYAEIQRNELIASANRWLVNNYDFMDLLDNKHTIRKNLQSMYGELTYNEIEDIFKNTTNIKKKQLDALISFNLDTDDIDISKSNENVLLVINAAKEAYGDICNYDFTMGRGQFDYTALHENFLKRINEIELTIDKPLINVFANRIYFYSSLVHNFDTKELNDLYRVIGKKIDAVVEKYMLSDHLYDISDEMYGCLENDIAPNKDLTEKEVKELNDILFNTFDDPKTDELNNIIVNVGDNEVKKNEIITHINKYVSELGSNYKGCILYNIKKIRANQFNIDYINQLMSLTLLEKQSEAYLLEVFSLEGNDSGKIKTIIDDGYARDRPNRHLDTSNCRADEIEYRNLETEFKLNLYYQLTTKGMFNKLKNLR